MRVQVVLSSESLVAVWALKRFQSCVNKLVFDAVRAISESSAADFASVGLRLALEFNSWLGGRLHLELWGFVGREIGIEWAKIHHRNSLNGGLNMFGDIYRKSYQRICRERRNWPRKREQGLVLAFPSQQASFPAWFPYFALLLCFLWHLCHPPYKGM